MTGHIYVYYRSLINIMSLASTAQSWVLSLLAWSAVIIQTSFFPSFLCLYVVYSLLIVTTMHSIIHSLTIDSEEIVKGYMGAVLPMAFYSTLAVFDTFPVYTFGTHLYSPGVNSTLCCSNSDIVKTNQVFYFSDTPFFSIPAGVLVGYVVVQFLTAASGVSSLPGVNSIWPGFLWGHVMAILQCMRFLVLYSNIISPICPEGTDYMQVLGVPLIGFYVIYYLFIAAFIGIIVLDCVPFEKMSKIIIRSVGLVIVLAYALLSIIASYYRIILTVPLLITILIPVFPSLWGLLELFLTPIAPAPIRGRTSRLVDTKKRL